MTMPPGTTGKCLIALADLGEASGKEVYNWLCRRGITVTIVQVRKCLYDLSHNSLPLVEMAGRSEKGSGRPGTWRLTARGLAFHGKDAPS
jgi:hypothetical protein